MKKRRNLSRNFALRMLTALLVFAVVLGTVPVSAATKSVKVSTKKKLVAELKKSNSETIVFTSATSKTVTIPAIKAAKNKKLVINAPKAKIVNKSTLKSMTLEACSTFTEKASGNKITIKDKNTVFKLAAGKKLAKLTASAASANISAAKNAVISSLVCNKKSASVKLDVASGADVNVNLSKKTSIEVTGSTKADVAITASAKSCSVTTSVPVELDAKADLKLNLAKGSEGSVVNSAKSVSVKVDNNSTETPTIKEDGKVVSEAKTISAGNKDNNTQNDGKGTNKDNQDGNTNAGKNDIAGENSNTGSGNASNTSSDNSTGNVGSGSTGGSTGFGPGLSGGSTGGTGVVSGGSGNTGVVSGGTDTSSSGASAGGISGGSTGGNTGDITGGSTGGSGNVSGGVSGGNSNTPSGNSTGNIDNGSTSSGSSSGNSGSGNVSDGSSSGNSDNSGATSGSTDPIPVQSPEQPSNPGQSSNSGQTNSPSTNPEPSVSPSTNNETSTSPSVSPEVSTSPSASPEVSTSPSVSPEVSTSPSVTPETSPSPSENPETSPSPSENPETSPSPSENPEISPSPSENPVISPSPSENPETSPSPSENPETSPSPSENPETSPSPSENPETSPSPSENPEISPSPSENPETSPSPSENPETSPSPSENPEISPSPSENPETSPSPSVSPSVTTGPTPTPEGSATLRFTYGQTQARSMLELINSYRASHGTSSSSKNALIYDYDLEKAAMQRAAEIAVRFEEENHYRPDGYTYEKTLQEYGFDISPRNILYAENILSYPSDNPSMEAAFDSLATGETGSIMCSESNYVGIGHIRINKTDYWVQLFSNEEGRASTYCDALDGQKDININIPNRFVESVTPVYVSGNTSVSVGSTVAVPVYTAKATFVDSDAGEVTVVGNLAFESENAYVKASNGMMTGLQAGTGSISASLLGKTVSVDITVNAASPLQQLVDNAESYPNTVLNVSDSEVAKSEADVNKPIYDRVTSNFTSGSLVVNSFDLLKSEEDYVASFPSVKTIVFSNAKIYKNVSTVNFVITYKEHSFLSEERAVDYALTNGSEDYLTTSDKELYDKIVTLSTNLRGNTEYDTVKNIHDYLVENIAYTLPQSSQDMSVYSARGALFRFQSVCDGYAKSFYLLCKACGVEAVYVAGTATNRSGASENHAWNKVKAAEKWYAIDCTWDDPTPDNAGVVRYEYFLITDQDMATNHVWDDTDLPAATSTDLGIVYETYKNVPKFTSDADAIAYIREELGKVFNQSGFNFTITVLSSDGSTLGNDIKSLAAEYNSTYGCGYSYHAESAGFYGTKYDVEIYK